MSGAAGVAPRAPLVAAGASLVAAVPVAALAVATVETEVRAIVTLTAVAAVGGVLLVALSLLGNRPEIAVGGVAALGVAYGAAVAAAGGPVDVRAPAVAGALFLVAECAFWSHDLRRVPIGGPGVAARRVGWLATTAVASAAAGCGLLVLGAVDLGWGLTAETLGVLAAVGVAATALLAGRR